MTVIRTSRHIYFQQSNEISSRLGEEKVVGGQDGAISRCRRKSVSSASFAKHRQTCTLRSHMHRSRITSSLVSISSTQTFGSWRTAKPAPKAAHAAPASGKGLRIYPLGGFRRSRPQLYGYRRGWRPLYCRPRSAVSGGRHAGYRLPYSRYQFAQRAKKAASKQSSLLTVT